MRRPRPASRPTSWAAYRAIAALAAACVLVPVTSVAATPRVDLSAGSAGQGRAQVTVAMVADLNPGSAPSRPDLMTAAHGSLFFSAVTPGIGREPWVSDGTPEGTRLVGDFVPGAQSSELRHIATTAADTILALDNRGAVPSGPWTGSLWATTTTGAAAGTTTLLKEGRELSTDATRFGDDALVHSSDFQDRGASLWRTDGTPVGTRLVRDGFILGINLSPTPTKAFFTSAQSSLMVTDGTTAGTRRLRTWGDGPGGSTLVMDMDTAGERAFFDVDATYALGSELWVSNGTRAGTQVLKDINPGRANGDPAWLTPLKGRMYFVANDGRHDVEVWRSDGTARSTVRITNLSPSGVRNLVACRGQVYFTTSSADSATLWSTKGKPGRYTLVATLPGSRQARPTKLACMAGGLVFSADDGVHGREPWTLATGARRPVLHDLMPGERSSRPFGFTRIGARLFLIADDGVHGEEVWAITS